MNITTSSTKKLTLVERLVPPLKSVGQGPHALRYTSPSPAWSVDFSRDGLFLAVCYGAPDPCVRIWKRRNNSNSNNAVTNNKTKQDHDKEQDTWILHSTLEGIHARTIRSVAFAPLASPYVLAAASFDASVSIWELSSSSSKLQQQQPTNGSQQQEWECTTQLEGHDHEIKSVTWNATGSLLATCGRDKT